jgi:uncharacterized protein (TIGR02466 family)
MVERTLHIGSKEMIKDLFSTPVYVSKIQNEKVDYEIKSILLKDIFSNNWQPDNDTAKTTFNPGISENIIAEYQLNAVADEILDHAEAYIKSVGQEIIEHSAGISSSWINTFDKDQLIGFHEHGYQPNQISGCYYYQTSENCGDIQFKSTNPFVVSFPHQTSKYNNIYNVKAEKGTVILFPSWLMHKVLPNRSNTKRISLAFNIDFRYTYQE